MQWGTEKYSFSFDPELDQEIIRLIESVPKGKRSRLARKVFREYLESQKKVVVWGQGMKVIKKEGNNGDMS